MEILSLENVSFRYNGQQRQAVKNITLSIEEGEMVLLCGMSGCGKSTLLRLMEPSLMPYGEFSGKIRYMGTDSEEMDPYAETCQIGFVSQNPENQIVTEKVWHEMVFGLENIGLSQKEMERRVSEMASYFGIENWFHKNVRELSGGQKQKLNLASVMAMEPKLLLLDEPTSMLDPIAASDFLSTVKKLNDELGITVILVEHNLEEAFPLCSKILVMEDGCLKTSGSPREVGHALRQHPISAAFPAALRCYNNICSHSARISPPITVSEGRRWIRSETAGRGINYNDNCKELTAHSHAREKDRSDIVLEGKNLTYRYEKNSRDILRNLSIRLGRGEILAVMGGNGSGKSTLLTVLSSLKKPLAGKVRCCEKIAFLPQNPQLLFVKDRVDEDLLDALPRKQKKSDAGIKAADQMLRLLELDHLRESHPYDLSGGEQQRLAIGKVLLTDPRILLLDEPTKGLDSFAKRGLCKILKKLKNDGCSILLVSHDTEFCSLICDRCCLLFDGRITGEGKSDVFFTENKFYTTAACRMTSGIMSGCVRTEDIIQRLSGGKEAYNER